MTATDWYARYRVILFIAAGLVVAIMVGALIVYALQVAAAMVARMKERIDR